MPELRQNPATKEWVIIATERAKRPEELGTGVIAPPANEKDHCPFCQGNEKKTPNELFSYRTYGTAPNTPGWWIRVIPNMFPALMPQGNPDRVHTENLFLSMNGIGQHEVLIETPEHTHSIATMPQQQVEEICLAYRERYIALSQDPRYEMITIFKNHGLNAGTSLRHPHSQIIATPITPMHIRHRIEEAMRYFDDHGSCVYCDIIEKEKKIGERVVADIRKAVFAQVLKLEPAFFEVTRTGEVISRLTTDTSLLQVVVGSTLAIAVRNALLISGGLVMLTITSGKLALLVLLGVPLAVIPLWLLGHRVRRLSRTSQDRIADIGAFVDEVLYGIRTVQAFCHERIDHQRYGEQVEADRARVLVGLLGGVVAPDLAARAHAVHRARALA